MRKREQFVKASWYLSRGYPQAWVAWRLGVHHQTVKAWSRRLAFDKDERAVHRLVARIRRLPWHLREYLRERLAALDNGETSPASFRLLLTRLAETASPLQSE